MTSDIKTLKIAVLEAVNATREFAGLIGVNLDSSPVLGKVKRAMAAVAASGGAALDSALAADEGNDGTPETQEQRGTRRHQFLTNAISELTTAIIERASLNDLFAMVLEALYRSMDFTHVLFLLRDPARKTYATRFGFGADVEELKSRFEYRPEAREDIFQQAVQKGRNAVIIDTDDERYSLSIPDWCREMTRPRSILVFAVIVNKVCVGVIYADTCTEQLCVNAQELQLLNTLVKQLTLGVHQR